MRIRWSDTIAWAVLLNFLLLCSASRAAMPDGPYILRSEDGGWESVSVAAGGVAAQRQLVKTGDSITVPAVGKLPAFAVTLRAPAVEAADSVTSTAAAPVFVVADTHGEFEILVALLRAHQVVGAKLQWSYGRGHLVVLGDVFDRGPNHLEILWLLYQLEAEARKAGGGVHLVLGNHEAMVMLGDLRYLHPKYVESARVLSVSNYSSLFAADTLLGQWLRTRPAMLKVNDMLCVHAGVSRALLDSTLTMADVNTAVRAALSGQSRGAIAALVTGSLGPLWYRGYFAGQADYPAASDEDVDLVLRTFLVRRILVGHTVVPTVTPLYGGKVIAVQVYPRRDTRGEADFAGLVIRNREPWQARLDGSRTRLRSVEGS